MASQTVDAAFLAESRQNEVYATHIAFFVMMLIIVPCRFFSARVSGKKLGWDDWLAYFAAVSTFSCYSSRTNSPSDDSTVQHHRRLHRKYAMASIRPRQTSGVGCTR
jgi:hypothetical protein